jgi:hypothetical protein
VSAEFDTFKANVVSALTLLQNNTPGLNMNNFTAMQKAIAAAETQYEATLPVPLPPSTITAASGGSLTDAAGAVWTFGSPYTAPGYKPGTPDLQILKNGVWAYPGALGGGVTITLVNGVAWVQNSPGYGAGWYKNTGSGWALQSGPPGSSPTPTPPPDGSIAVTIAVNPTARHIPHEFFGYSFEKPIMMIKGGYDAANTGLVALYKLLGGGVLRPGANEWCAWEGGGPGHHYTLDGQSYVSEVDITQLKGFLDATGWKVLYECPWFKNNGGNVFECEAVASIIGQDKVTYFQFGNEPDLSGGYGKEAHDSWLGWATNIRNTVPWASFCGNCNCEPPPIDPPAFSNWSHTAPFVRDMSSHIVGGRPLLNMVTKHWYAGFIELGSGNQIDTMLSHNQDQVTILSEIAQIAADPGGPDIATNAAAAYVLNGGYGLGLDQAPAPGKFPGIPWRIEETNSLAGGGEAGVSNTFGAALWSVNYCFMLAAMGADGLNFHLGDTANYDAYHISIFSQGGTPATGALYEVCPPFYGHLAFTQCLPGKLLSVQGSLPAKLTINAVAKDDGTTAIALVNADRTTPMSVTLTLPAAISSAKSLLLAAPSLESLSGNVTLGGAQVGIDGSWNPTPIPLTPSGAALSVTVAPASGQIIFVS